MIIGICGLIGSGKGTVSDYLVDEYGFEKISFADKLLDSIDRIVVDRTNIKFCI